MTDKKFCDIHASQEKRDQDRDNVQTIVVEKWMKVKGSNRLFEQRLDACVPDIQKQILDRAVALGVDIGKNWKTAVWKEGKSGKKFRTMMTMDELLVHLDEEAKAEEMKELKALRSQIGKA